MAVKDRIWTIPNLLSVLRFFLILPILIALQNEQRWLALLLMTVGLATDSIDGYIARRFDQCSDLGRLLDPVIDKVALLAAVIFMFFHPAYRFPLWYFIFLAAREFLILIGGLFMLRGREIVMESDRPGKNSAFANGLTVVFYVIDLQPYALIILWIAFVLTVYSTWNYARKFLRNRRVVPPTDRGEEL